MNNTQTFFLLELVQLLPALRPIYIEHLNDNGEMLPHVLMGDFTRFIVQNVTPPSNEQNVQPILDSLEEALTGGNPELDNLVGVSFVESLQGEEKALKVLVNRVGPALREEIKAICGY
jgi:hypothetical protein